MEWDSAGIPCAHVAVALGILAYKQKQAAGNSSAKRQEYVEGISKYSWQFDEKGVTSGRLAPVTGL